MQQIAAPVPWLIQGFCSHAALGLAGRQTSLISVCCNAISQASSGVQTYRLDSTNVLTEHCSVRQACIFLHGRSRQQHSFRWLRVPLKIVHIYTLIQLSILVILWVVKSTIIGLSFPLFVLATIPLRLVPLALTRVHAVSVSPSHPPTLPPSLSLSAFLALSLSLSLCVCVCVCMCVYVCVFCAQSTNR